MALKIIDREISDTKKIDLLLERVNSVDRIVRNRHKNKIKYPNFKIKKYKSSKIWTEGMIDVYDALNNTYNQFDHELAKLIKLDIYWYRRYYSRYSGIYYPGYKRIRLNFAWESLFKTVETFYHELGHAWYFQLPEKFKPKKYKKNSYPAWKCIRKYLELETNTLFSSFTKAKPLIRKNISFYAAKNITECFAELFSKSCIEVVKLRKENKDPLIESNAFKAISYYNELIKN